MSDGSFTPGEGSELVAPRRSSRARVMTLLVAGIALVAGAGVATGVVLERTVLSHHDDHGRGPGGRRGGDRGAIHERFSRDLGLSKAQEAKIDSIFASHRPAIDSARALSEPRIRALIDQTRREVDSVLTPEQRTKMHERAKREHPPGDSMSPGGRPPRPF